MDRPTLLYITTDDHAAAALRRRCEALQVDLDCRPPASVLRPADLQRISLIVLDGQSLKSHSIDLARRIRWLGFSRPVLLAWSAESELDRVVARESGVDDIVAPSLITAALAGRYPSLARPQPGRAGAPSAAFA
jgi:DNA-binding response OmpR family regulator